MARINKKDEAPQLLIYVGPSTKSIRQYSSYIGGYPKQLESLLKENPVLNSMFISPEELDAFEKDRKVKGTAASVTYEKAKTILLGGNA
ncbi:MAG: hypothetical protein ABS917_05445 [Solibacillus sp.]|uniref:hypothetical protein n=1 Tax=Solibacillus sp. TaxID=1909654 RepID=UPI003314BD9F